MSPEPSPASVVLVNDRSAISDTPSISTASSSKPPLVRPSSLITTSPLDLDGDYCGSSADEEDDNTEMNYTISNDTDNYILKGYLYKRGVKDELVWYKRWFVLYHGSLWYWKSRHFQIDPTEIPLANAKLRRSPIAKKNRFMRLAFEIETPRRVYYLRIGHHWV